eukprot:1139053-Lingulodinium_polyedra.AAC.1
MPSPALEPINAHRCAQLGNDMLENAPRHPARARARKLTANTTRAQRTGARTAYAFGFETRGRCRGAL